jgi:hypothetical protein
MRGRRGRARNGRRLKRERGFADAERGPGCRACERPDGSGRVQKRDRCGYLWVPRTSSTSRDQAVFADHATDASLPPDAVLIKIDRFG